jgi:hypothetical protein
MSTPPYNRVIVPSKRTLKVWEIFGFSFPRYCIARFALTTLDGIFLNPLSNDKQDDDDERANSDLDPTVKEAAALFRKLTETSDAELAELYEACIQKQKAAAEAKHYLNRKEALADSPLYDIYAKAAYWELEEGAALILERNPEHLNVSQINSYSQKPEIAKKFIIICGLAQRAGTMGQIKPHNSPSEFLNWAQECRLPIPKELTAAVKIYAPRLTDWKIEYERKHAEVVELTKEIVGLREGSPMHSEAHGEKPFSVRERESLLKIIIGMAMEQYAHDPYAKRTETAKQIESDIVCIGLSMDQDTIRKYLAEAKERFIPRKPE